MKNALKIGDLARRAGCPVETIRFYEREGLLPIPARSAGNYRQYDERHVERLTFIRRCRAFDMALGEIRSLLRLHDAPEEDCDAVNDLLDAHVGHVVARIEELKDLEAQLRALRRQCGVARQAKDCGILNALSQACPAHHDDGTDAGHVPGTHGMRTGNHAPAPPRKS